MSIPIIDNCDIGRLIGINKIEDKKIQTKIMYKFVLENQKYLIRNKVYCGMYKDNTIQLQFQTFCYDNTCDYQIIISKK